MLVTQTGALLFALDSIFRRNVASRTAAVIAVVIVAFSLVLAPMGAIWKDSQMGGFAMLGIALLAGKRSHRSLGCAAWLVATAIRYNAPAATLPLFDWSNGRRRYLVAVGEWIALTAVAIGANGVPTVREEHERYSLLALHDIVGTLRFAPKESPAAIDRELAGTPLVVTDDPQKHCRWQYQPTTHWNLWHGERRILDPARTDADRAAIRNGTNARLAPNPSHRT